MLKSNRGVALRNQESYGELAGTRTAGLSTFCLAPTCRTSYRSSTATLPQCDTCAYRPSSVVDRLCRESLSHQQVPALPAAS